MVTFSIAFLLTGYLVCYKIVAGLLALQDAAHLGFVALVIVACCIAGGVPAILCRDYEKLRRVLRCRWGSPRPGPCCC